MKTHSRMTAITSIGAIFSVLSLFTPIAASAATNLIQNPTFTLGTGNVADNWIQGSWGAATTAVFTYPVAGQDDAFAAQVSIPTYNNPGNLPGQGSAEWIAANSTVTPGQIYSFSNWYKSDANSFMVAQWVLNDNSLLSEPVGTFGPTSGLWAQSNELLGAPTNAKAVSVIHYLQSVGTLAVDNFNLNEGVTAAQGQLSKGVVSLTFDDGLSTQFENAFPILSAAGLPGTFYLISDDVLASTYDFFTDTVNEADLTKITDANTSSWAPIYMDPTVQALRFSDTYTSADSSTITATWNGGANSMVIGTLPAATNGHASFAFTLPTNLGSTVSPIAIVHSSTGALTTSNPSLVPTNRPNFGPQQALELQAAGEELGAHTKTHPDLTSLNPVQAADEISGSRTVLQGLGATPVDTFAYPYGGYNPAIETLSSAAGYIGARTVDIGYNSTLTDKYALKSQSVVQTTTLPTVKGWIDTAIANKLWLVLVFHDVDSDANLTANGEIYGTTPQMLQDIVDYLKSKGSDVDVKTVHQVLAATDATAPTIAPHANISVTTTSSSGMTVTYVTPTATDDVDGPVSVTCLPVSGSNFPVGTTTVSCTAQDVATNVANSTFDIGVALLGATPTDTTAPVITLLGSSPVTINVNDLYTDAGATAADDTDGNITGNIVVTSDVDPTIVGTYTVRYNVSDAALNAATQVVRTVNVVSPTTGGSGSSDICANLDGVQTEMPANMHFDGGLCVADVNPSGNNSGNGGGGGGGNGPIVGSYATYGGTVLGASIGPVGTSSNNTQPTTPSAPKYVFTKTLKRGSTGADVTALQQILIALSFLNIDAPTGYFGSATKAAVIKFQESHTIAPAIGIVGPLTRAVLKAL